MSAAWVAPPALEVAGNGTPIWVAGSASAIRSATASPMVVAGWRGDDREWREAVLWYGDRSRQRSGLATVGQEPARHPNRIGVDGGD